MIGNDSKCIPDSVCLETIRLFNWRKKNKDSELNLNVLSKGLFRKIAKGHK